MSAQEDATRDAVQSYAERWATESLYLSETAEEQQSPVVRQWYEAHAPFGEEQELEQLHGSEAEEYSAELESEESGEAVFEPLDQASDLNQEQSAGTYEYLVDVWSDHVDLADRERGIETIEPELNYEDRDLATEICEQEFSEEEGYAAELDDEAVFELVDEASKLREEWAVGDNEYPVNKLAEADSLLEAQFEPLVGEAEALLDKIGEELQRHDSVATNEAEIDNVLDRYEAPRDYLSPEAEHFLGNIINKATGLFRNAVKLALNPTTASAPDPTAAVSPFTPDTKRRMEQSILNPERSAAAINWNRTQHPAHSGVEPVDIQAKLARYVDFDAVRTAIAAYNTSHSAASIAVGTPPIDAVFVEAAHQFQAKCFAEAGQRDGKVGESTLDSLGVVQRRGLNTVDKVNKTAQGRLTAKAKQVSQVTGEEFSAQNWFDHMVNPTFLGRRFKNGIHLVLARKLRIAEAHLLSLPAYAGKTPVGLGETLGVNEEHKGARPNAPSKSVHTLGLAVDIKYMGNPWVDGNPDNRTGNQQFTQALKNAALLVSGTVIPFNSASEYFHSLIAVPNASTESIYATLSQRDADLRAYLGLANNSEGIVEKLRERRAANMLDVFQRSDETIEAAARRWQHRIGTDLSNLRASTSNFGRERDPLNGFLNLPRDLVVALRDKACLAWGAVDFGASASGDMMHFDCRIEGVGSVLNASVGYEPKKGKHPCLPSAVSSNGSSQEVGQVAEVFNVERAVQLNRRYAQSLGWPAHSDRIMRLLGFTTYTPGEREFAEAVANWQRSQGLGADGILGPNTWSRMQAAMRVAGTVPAAVPSPASPVTPQLCEPSGQRWVNRFPTSRSTADLVEPFRGNVERFLAALRAAGLRDATNVPWSGPPGYKIAATYRPPERAYLMHHAWRIAREGMGSARVPLMTGVDICWLHRDASGRPDEVASRVAAEQMVRAYGMQHRAALRSRHTQGRAIDVRIEWTGTLNIADANGNIVQIDTPPRTGSENRQLWAVGRTYGVIKLLDDPPHWSDDGH